MALLCPLHSARRVRQPHAERAAAPPGSEREDLSKDRVRHEDACLVQLRIGPGCTRITNNENTLTSSGLTPEYPFQNGRGVSY